VHKLVSNQQAKVQISNTCDTAKQLSTVNSANWCGWGHWLPQPLHQWMACFADQRFLLHWPAKFYIPLGKTNCKPTKTGIALRPHEWTPFKQIIDNWHGYIVTTSWSSTSCNASWTRTTQFNKPLQHVYSAIRFLQPSSNWWLWQKRYMDVLWVRSY